MIVYTSYFFTKTNFEITMKLIDGLIIVGCLWNCTQANCYSCRWIDFFSARLQPLFYLSPQFSKSASQQIFYSSLVSHQGNQVKLWLYWQGCSNAQHSQHIGGNCWTFSVGLPNHSIKKKTTCLKSKREISWTV